MLHQQSDTFNIITQVLSAKYHGALIMDAVNYNLHGSLNIWCISKLLYKSIVVGPQFHSKNWAGTCIFIFLRLIEIASKLLPSFLKKNSGGTLYCLSSYIHFSALTSNSWSFESHYPDAVSFSLFSFLC